MSNYGITQWFQVRLVIPYRYHIRISPSRLRVDLVGFLGHFIQRSLRFLVTLSFRRVITQVRARQSPTSIKGTINRLTISVVRNVARVLFIVQVRAILRRRNQNDGRIYPTSSRNGIRKDLIFCSQAFPLSSSIGRSSEGDTIVFFRISISNARISSKENPSSMANQRSTFMGIRVLSSVHVRYERRPSRIVSLVGKDSIGRGRVFVVPTSIGMWSKGRFYSKQSTKGQLGDLCRVK